jgi:hypothetical protein
LQYTHCVVLMAAAVLSGCIGRRLNMTDTKWREVATHYLAMHNRYTALCKVAVLLPCLATSGPISTHRVTHVHPMAPNGIMACTIIRLSLELSAVLC